LILLNSYGKPWTSDGFRTPWGKACAAARVVGLTFHDLRGTAVTRLAIAGCTKAEIATITGHSLRDVHAILASFTPWTNKPVGSQLEFALTSCCLALALALAGICLSHF
jgi:integrase